MRDLVELLRAFADLEVLVIGEAMLDSYQYGTAEQLCREAPVPVVSLGERDDAAGGAANAAANVAALGARASFLSVVGDDEEGRRLRAELRGAGVDTRDLVASPLRRTLTKSRVVAGGQLLLRLDHGTTSAVPEGLQAELLQRLRRAYRRADAVIVSDYAYGVVTPALVAELARLQAADPRVLVVDSKYPERYREVGATAVKPNYAEACRLLGLHAVEEGRAEQLTEHEGRLFELTGARMVAATLDVDGALLFEHGAPPYRTYARAAAHSRAAGAGDTFTSALTLALASGAEAPQAADCAAAAAAVVVEEPGTATCDGRALAAYLTGERKLLASVAEVGERMRKLRREGKRVVFTNGCFDILHRGHVTYLSRAKALGDVLVVGLNSDASIRGLKGPGRPINSLEDRAQVLAALSCVDYIAPFGEPTPDALIELVRPDLFVKGGDYTEDRLPEARLVRELGGEVEILPFLGDLSTTGIIERVRRAFPNQPSAGPTGLSEPS